MTKTSRQYLIARLLESHSVSNQRQLVNLLRSQGVRSTRATVSRDLDDLGAVKIRVSGNQSVYAIPEYSVNRIVPDDHLRRVLSDWVASVVSSGNLVVLRTPPGSAHVVASALDRAGLSELVGTVAGDDTVIVVSAEGVSGIKLADRLRELAGLETSHDCESESQHEK